MKHLNPELETQIDGLAALCCAALSGEESDVVAKSEPLIKALVVGGYARISDINLQARVEAKTAERCQERVIHRRESLTGLTSRMQSKFNELVQWQTTAPKEGTPPKSANLSSAHES